MSTIYIYVIVDQPQSHRTLLPVEEAQHLETWRELIAREVKISLPSSIRGRARSDRSDTALSSTDCLRKHGTHGERRRGGLRCAALPEAAGTSTMVGLQPSFMRCSRRVLKIS